MSLKRRVPDESLARVYRIDPSEVSRRRTAAIERLADELRIESGEELGAVLEELVGSAAEPKGKRAPARRLRVRRDGRTVRSYAVAVGAPDHPTPRGRFSVTDRLRVTNGASPYGCCVLALTGHQVRLPAGWPGRDRLAVHAANDLSSIGRPVSFGCIRADARRARWLIETIPLGRPIFIRS